MARESIEIVISSRGGKGVRRDLDEIGGSATRTARAMQTLTRTFVAFAAAASVRQIIQYADAFTQIQNRLRTVTDGTAELTAVTNELFAIAQRTRASFESTAEVYTRTALATRELGLSAQETLQFTESLNQAVILSGASAQEANAALIQLSQGLASGALRGDELRSVLEQLPTVADVIAKQLGVTRGQLRELGKEGKITADVVIEAFKSAQEELETGFGETVPTIAQAFTVLRNAVIQTVGVFNEFTNANGQLAQAILFVAENIETILRTAGGLIVTFGLLAGPAAIGAVINGLRTIAVLIATNPFGALATGIAFAVGQLVAFQDQLRFSIQGLATVGDFGVAVWNRIKAGIEAVVRFFQSNFPNIASVAQRVFGDIEFSLQGFLQVAANVVDSVVGFFIGGWNAVVAASTNAAAAIANAFIQAFNFVRAQFTELINGILTGYNAVITALGGQAVGLIEAAAPIEEFQGAGQTAAQAFADGFAGSTAASDLLGSIQAEAETIAQNRIADERLISLAEEAEAVNVLAEANDRLASAVGTPGSGSGGSGSNAALEAQNETLQRLDNLYDEVTGGMDGLLQKQADLATLFEQGRISAEQYTAAMRDLNVEISSLDNSIQGGIQNGIDRLIARANDLGTTVSDIVVNAFDSLTDTLVNFAKTGEFAWREFLSSIFEQLFRLAANQLFAQLLGGLGGGGGLTGLLGGLFGFAEGGSIMPSGPGRTDSQVVAFKKRPDERVDVLTPEQQAAQARAQGGGGGGTTVNTTTNVAAVLSESDIANAMDTSVGETVILNVLERNRTTVQQIAGA